VRSAYGLEATRDNGWRWLAACSVDTADWFFITSRSRSLSPDNRRALRICAKCPVRIECLIDALEDPEKVPRIAGGHVMRDGGIVAKGKR